MLDSEYQNNTEKIISLKDALQKDYDSLEDRFNQLRNAKKQLELKSRKDVEELNDIKTKYREVLEKLESEKNEIDTCGRCEELLRDHCALQVQVDEVRKQLVVIKNNNATLTKVLDDTKTSNDQELTLLTDKLKLSESENRILVTELQKSSQVVKEFQRKSAVDEENFKKLASILDGYEQKVSSLEDEMANSRKDGGELDRLKTLVEEYQVQLQELGNTEADVAILTQENVELKDQIRRVLEDKENIHRRYVNILSNNVKKYVDCEKPSDFELATFKDDPHVSEFNNQVENLLKILLDLRCKCENLEKEVYIVTEEKTKLLTEKNHEIEKLLHNSEILSQEVITKSRTIKDYENECSELIKNNDLLITELEGYKNNSGLQTISESNEDNLLLLETQLDTANKKIEELQRIVHGDNEQADLNKDTNRSTSKDYDQIKNENSDLKEEVRKLEEDQEIVLEENDKLNAALERMRMDLENTEYQYTEINVNMEALRDEVENQKKKVEELIVHNSNLEKLNLEYERANEDVRGELNSLREKLLLEEDTRKQLESQARSLIEKLQNAKMCETSLKLQYDTISKELTGMIEANSALELSSKSTLTELQNCQIQLSLLREEHDSLRSTWAELSAELTRKDDEVARLSHELMEKNEELARLCQELTGKDIDIARLKTIEDQFRKLPIDESAETSDLVDTFTKQHLHLRQQLDKATEERDCLQTEIDRLVLVTNEHKGCVQNLMILRKTTEDLNAAKAELTNMVIAKHQENVTYHNEIQRLSQILQAEVDKARQLEEKLQDDDKFCGVDVEELAKKNAELDRLTDQNSFLKQKCEVLAENLLLEQSKFQQLLADRSGASEEKEAILTKKLERLQSHLIEVEEHYTQELLKAEEKKTELQAKMNEIEQREKNSSTMYTSVSIRANQHVETLQHQLQLVTNQRDELRKKISDAEDNANKQTAALTNLQFVLEQFQKDRDKDIQQETERIRRQIGAEKRVQEELRKEIASLQSQLKESKQGLLAASRLSDQLEQAKQTIANLKGEVSQFKEKLSKSEEQLKNVSSQTDGKVDKSLIKNLIVGFISTNNNLTKDQIQILKIIATVLDFNKQDHDKVGLNRPHQGWLESLLSPQASQGMSQESLSQAFVKFLEKESKPRVIPNLLNNNVEEATLSRKNSSTSAPGQSPLVLSEVVLPTLADFAQSRNSSSILKDVLKDNS